MGSYLYEQTPKQFKVQVPDYGIVTANEVKYWCKPYLDLWDGSYMHNLSPAEKRDLAVYNRKRAACAKRQPSEWVVRTGDGSLNGEPVNLLYRWADMEKASTLFFDDSTFGVDLIKVGEVRANRLRGDLNVYLCDICNKHHIVHTWHLVNETKCKECTKALDFDGFCKSVTCPFSQWPQRVDITAIMTMPRNELEAAGIKKKQGFYIEGSLQVDDGFISAVAAWINLGLDPGSCTRLLLEGKYEEGYRHAHELIRAHWPDHIQYIEKLPAECRGGNMEEWERRHQEDAGRR